MILFSSFFSFQSQSSWPRSRKKPWSSRRRSWSSQQVDSLKNFFVCPSVSTIVHSICVVFVRRLLGWGNLRLLTSLDLDMMFASLFLFVSMVSPVASSSSLTIQARVMTMVTSARALTLGVKTKVAMWICKMMVTMMNSSKRRVIMKWSTWFRF